MIEILVPSAIAVVTGGGVLFNRIHNRIHDLDRRVDGIELRMAESYVNKDDFNSALSRMESHMIRIEEKLDQIASKRCP